MIRVQGLRYAWPGAADNLVIDTLHVDSGRTVFLHGPSGCGKSTLLGLMAGVLQAREGTVSLLGQDWAALPAGRRDQRRADHVGVIFQQFNLLPYLSVLDNVLLPTRFSARRATRCEDRPAASASALLQRVGLGEALHGRRADALSVGQQQRVAAARALIGAPELLVADEPTSALDASRQQGFLALLREEAAASGAALLFVSHDTRLEAGFSASYRLAPMMEGAA